MEGALESALLAVGELLHRAGRTSDRWALRAALEGATEAGSVPSTARYVLPQPPGWSD
jgi:hypothetical protein